MAKKKTGRAPSRGAAKKKVKAVKAKHKAPRAVALPGLEEVRVRALDGICSSIAETRSAVNDLRAEEAGLEQTALTLMRKHDRTSYQHAGVELVRVPGEERLRVRTSRERTATAEAEPPTDAGGDDAGDVGNGLDHGDTAGDE